MYSCQFTLAGGHGLPKSKAVFFIETDFVGGDVDFFGVGGS